MLFSTEIVALFDDIDDPDSIADEDTVTTHGEILTSQNLQETLRPENVYRKSFLVLSTLELMVEISMLSVASNKDTNGNHTDQLNLFCSFGFRNILAL